MLDPMLFTTTNKCRLCGAKAGHNCTTSGGKRLHIFQQHADRAIRKKQVPRRAHRTRAKKVND